MAAAFEEEVSSWAEDAVACGSPGFMRPVEE